MQFMVLSRRRSEQFTDADFDRIIPDETHHVRQLYADGVIRQIWLRDDFPGACFTIEAADAQTAQIVVSGLPMARTGL